MHLDRSIVYSWVDRGGLLVHYNRARIDSWIVMDKRGVSGPLQYTPLDCKVTSGICRITPAKTTGAVNGWTLEWDGLPVSPSSTQNAGGEKSSTGSPWLASCQRNMPHRVVPRPYRCCGPWWLCAALRKSIHSAHKGQPTPSCTPTTSLDFPGSDGALNLLCKGF